MNFASDNWAGTSPRIIDILSRHAGGIVPAYGGDDLTGALKRQLAALFGREIGLAFAATGTAANSLALSALCPPFGAIYAHEEAHVAGSEAGAPEFFTQGGRLVELPGVDGKIALPALEAALARVPGSGLRIPLPSVLSLTQATECGTVYTQQEIEALSRRSRAGGLKIHMDGARFANAFAFLKQGNPSLTLADITWSAGIDALSLGFTKNGALMAEAVILFDPAKTEEIEWRRKRSGHVVSKAWPIAAQFLAMLEDNHWLELAVHANAMAADLSRRLVKAGHRLGFETQTNQVFPILSKALIARLRGAGACLYEWPHRSLAPACIIGPDEDLVRLVTSFATTAEEIEAFVGLAA